MAHLIDKSALVAEIERIRRIEVTNNDVAYNGALDEIRYFLDTLEVKEVDLEKEFDKCCEDYTFDDEWDVYIARRFFKLGFQKAQKGE
jgi:hypothetical protein